MLASARYLALLFIFAVIFTAQIGIAQTKTDNLFEDKNSGYDNKYLKLWQEGKLSTQPSFGGPILNLVNCYNNVTWINVGAPRGGDYIWVPGATRTYDFGPPKRRGQFVLGLFAPYYFCLVSPNPVVVFPGIIITMMGSSI